MAATASSVLESIRQGQRHPLYLVRGEEFLARRDADAIVQALAPGGTVGLNIVVLDGAGPREIAAELSTVSMFGGAKVVLVRDPEFLAPKKAKTDVLARAKDAWAGGRKKEAARRLLGVAAKAGWGVEALELVGVTAAAWNDELSISLVDTDLVWLREVASFCRAEGVASVSSDETLLVELHAQNRWPPEHSLVIAAAEVDAKASLVRFAKSSGVVLEHVAPSRLKDVDLSQIAKEVLRPLGKSIQSPALDRLKDACGGEMRLVASELEKLALYVDGDTIRVADVDDLVAHVREDEYLELADAISARDLARILKYVRDEQGRGASPLQALGAMTSVIRTLVVGAERVVHLAGGRVPAKFKDFEVQTFPKVAAEASAAGARPPHPYAAFSAMSAAARFNRTDLWQALVACAQADLALKLGGGYMVVERLALQVCGNAGPWDADLFAIRREQER